MEPSGDVSSRGLWPVELNMGQHYDLFVNSILHDSRNRTFIDVNLELMSQ